MARQGLDLIAAHFSLEPITDDAAAMKARPLFGFDKQEIVDRAKVIGTYEVSKGPEICDLLGPPRPSTHARLDQILAEETKLDLSGLVSSCLSKLAPEKFKANGPPAPLPPRTAV